MQRHVERMPRLLRGSTLLFFVAVCFTGSAVRVRAQVTEDPLARHLDAAEASLKNGDQEHAAAEYKAFLGEALHRVANARARAGDLSAAARIFAEALNIAGDDSGLRLDYASVLFDQNRSKDAAVAAQAVVNAEPDNMRGQVLLGRALFEQKEYSGAAAHLEKAAAAGELGEVWHLLGISYLRLQQLDNARSLLRRVVAGLGDTPQNRVAVAMTYYYGDYPDQAIEELKRVIAQNDAIPDAHYFLGLSYLARNEAAGYEKAVPEFRSLLRINSEDFRGHYMLGYIALQQRHFDKAEEELHRAAALNPADEGTQLLLGQLYSDTGRGTQAAEVLRKLIALQGRRAPDSGMVRAHYMLGRVLQQSGKAEEGAAEIRSSEQLRRQLRLNPAEISENRERSAAAGTGNGSEQGSRRAAATPAEQERAQAFIKQLSPVIGEAYYNLGGIAARHQDPAVAQEYLQKAVGWDPTLRAAQRP
ncbi:MAG: tetratricopeptide repeat protein [Acidobacteriia bacterium]|nr:tetratricopeptide repeat protein [Terriglobia bacterium]